MCLFVSAYRCYQNGHRKMGFCEFSSSSACFIINWSKTNSKYRRLFRRLAAAVVSSYVGMPLQEPRFNDERKIKQKQSPYTNDVNTIEPHPHRTMFALTLVVEYVHSDSSIHAPLAPCSCYAYNLHDTTLQCVDSVQMQLNILDGTSTRLSQCSMRSQAKLMYKFLCWQSTAYHMRRR